jgi:hypothetical protein
MKILPFLGFLLLSEAAAVALFVFCLVVLHFNPLGLDVNLILSLGGMVFGLIAGSGALPGARRAGIRPSLSVVAFVALVTGAAVFAYYYALFAIFVARFGDIASGASFGEFFDATVGHTRLSWSSASSSSSDIGNLGYGLFMLHIGWAMLTSIVWLTKLRNAAHCRKCGRYFEQREQRELLFFDRFALQELAVSLPEASAERASQLLRMPATQSYPPDFGVTRLEIRHTQCSGCHEHDATEITQTHNGKAYRDTKVVSYRWTGSGASRAAPGVQAPQPSAPNARPSFGRRGLG